MNAFSCTIIGIAVISILILRKYADVSHWRKLEKERQYLSSDIQAAYPDLPSSVIEALHREMLFYSNGLKIPLLLSDDLAVTWCMLSEDIPDLIARLAEVPPQQILALDTGAVETVDDLVWVLVRIFRERNADA